MKMNKMMKRIVTAFLALAMMITIIPAQKVEAVTNTRINVNTTQRVSLSQSDAMYSFKAPQDGYFSIEATLIEKRSMWSADFTVFDATGRQITETLKAKEPGLLCSTALFASKAGQVFNIKVSSPFDQVVVDFKVVYNTSANWENEFNNSAKTACILKNNQYKYGSITYKDEYDYFKFAVAKTSKVKITFGPKEITGNDNNWDVDIINTNNETVSLFNGTKTIKAKTVYLKKGTYYLRVRNYYNARYAAYKIKYQASAYTVKAPSLSKVTVKVSNSIFSKGKRYLNKISLKTSGYVDGYTVQVAKKKSMAGKYISTNVFRSPYNNYVTSKTIRFSDYTYKNGLKSKKATYYVRVRGIVKDPFGHFIYGKYSKIKKVTK